MTYGQFLGDFQKVDKLTALALGRKLLFIKQNLKNWKVIS
jgi:hypothetical protein